MSAEDDTRPLQQPITPEENPMTESPQSPTGWADADADARTTALPEAADRPARNDVRPVSLVMGVLYLGVVAVWALAQSAVLGVEDLGVVLPVMLLVAGLAGLAGLATRRRGPAGGTLG